MYSLVLIMAFLNIRINHDSLMKSFFDSTLLDPYHELDTVKGLGETNELGRSLSPSKVQSNESNRYVNI